MLDTAVGVILLLLRLVTPGDACQERWWSATYSTAR